MLNLPSGLSEMIPKIAPIPIFSRPYRAKISHPHPSPPQTLYTPEPMRATLYTPELIPTPPTPPPYYLPPVLAEFIRKVVFGCSIPYDRDP